LVLSAVGRAYDYRSGSLRRIYCRAELGATSTLACTIVRLALAAYYSRSRSHNDHGPMSDLEPVVQLDHEGRRFTFRVDHDPPLSFWRVDVDEMVYPSFLRVSGVESPAFFRNLANAVITDRQS
jgi:hypothetical protein